MSPKSYSSYYNFLVLLLQLLDNETYEITKDRRNSCQKSNTQNCIDLGLKVKQSSGLKMSKQQKSNNKKVFKKVASVKG